MTILIIYTTYAWHKNLCYSLMRDENFNFYLISCHPLYSIFGRIFQSNPEQLKKLSYNFYFFLTKLSYNLFSGRSKTFYYYILIVNEQPII